MMPLTLLTFPDTNLTRADSLKLQSENDTEAQCLHDAKKYLNWRVLLVAAVPLTALLCSYPTHSAQKNKTYTEKIVQ